MKMSALVGLLAVTASVTACASGGASGNESQSPGARRVPYGDTDVGSYSPGSGPATWYDVASPPLTTWQYLPVAYSRLGLTVTKYDSTTHVIEGERLRSRADFGGESLGSMLNCGDVAGVPNVTRYDINIQVRTTLRGSNAASSIANAVNATAKADATSGDAIPCSGGTGISDRVAAAITSAIAEGTK